VGDWPWFDDKKKNIRTDNSKFGFWMGVSRFPPSFDGLGDALVR